MYARNRFWVFPKGTGSTSSRVIDASQSELPPSNVEKPSLNDSRANLPSEPGGVITECDGHDLVSAFNLDSFDFNDDISLSDDDDGSQETDRPGRTEGSSPEQKVAKQLFMDMGVYTRNRAFRLYASCKRGKFPHILQPLDNRQTDVAAATTPKSSLANSSVNDARLEQHSRPDAGYMEADPTKEEYKLFCKSLVCPYSRAEVQSCSSQRILPCRFHSNSFVGGSSGKTSSSTQNTRTRGEVRTKSSYPKLDAFVLQEISARSGRSAFIRSVSEFNKVPSPNAEQSDEQRPPSCVQLATLIYEIGGNRWCARLGRQHRSNHVM